MSFGLGNQKLVCGGKKMVNGEVKPYCFTSNS